MAYKVEKGIPYPATPGTGGKYQFASMEVGDSFLVPDARARARNAAMIASRRWALVARNDCKFVSRAVDGGYRIWRIK